MRDQLDATNFGLLIILYLLHLVGLTSFHIKDAQSHEHQIQTVILLIHLPEIQYFSEHCVLAQLHTLLRFSSKRRFHRLL